MDKPNFEASNGMLLEGIFSSELVDSSGEVVSLKGIDISSMESGNSVANYEHLSASDGAGKEVVGKVVYVKKVFKQSDCDTDSEKYFFKENREKPFLYGVVRLFDTAGHHEAQDLAAQLRSYEANKEKPIIGFSIEGSTITKEGQIIKESIARKVAVTCQPCNKGAISRILLDKNPPEGFDKIDRTELAKKELLQDPSCRKIGCGISLSYNPIVGSDRLEKAISDLPKGSKKKSTVYSDTYNYNKVLTPEQKNLGYSISVKKTKPFQQLGRRQFPYFRAIVSHNGKIVGDVIGYLHRTRGKAIEPHSEIQKDHQGKGLGVAAYEALFSHMKNVEGINYVSGKEHSEAAHRVHLSLAKKHGIEYRAEKLERPWKVPYVSDYEEDHPKDITLKYSPYQYQLKAEIPANDLDESQLEPVYFGKDEIEKSEDPVLNLIKNLTCKGKPISYSSYDYSDILSPEQKHAGYSIVVTTPANFGDQEMFSGIFHNGNKVGEVKGYVRDFSSLEPHSQIMKEHRGKGLGVAAYEALYSHAKNTGITKVVGGIHTEAAHRVHLSLAKKHGLKYDESQPRKTIGDITTYGNYQYQLKAEIPANDLDESQLEPVYFGKDEIEKSEDPVLNLIKNLTVLKALKKTLCVGTTDVAPSSLTGGAALQREDLGKVYTGSVLAAARDYDAPWDRKKFKKHLKEYLNKAQLPEVSDSFLDHFIDVAESWKLKKSIDDLAKGAMARLAPFNPRTSNTGKELIPTINNWVGNASENARQRIAETGMGLDPGLRTRALHKLHSKTLTRRNPKTKEREFLLHRVMGPVELSQGIPGRTENSHGEGEVFDNTRLGQARSWSSGPHTLPSSEGYPYRVAAWVPEPKIAFSLHQFSEHPDYHPEVTDNIALEKEVIVHPGKFEVFHRGRNNDHKQYVNLLEKMNAYNASNIEQNINRRGINEKYGFHKSEEEPLEKMALIHYNYYKPMTVYRVQNEKGEGPYKTKLRSVQGILYWDSPARIRPEPDQDFEEEGFGQPGRVAYDKQFRFGFEKPEHAARWFGKNILKKLKEKGFELKPVKASHVWRGASGLQVMFEPHSSEKNLIKAEPDFEFKSEEEPLEKKEAVLADPKHSVIEDDRSEIPATPPKALTFRGKRVRSNPSQEEVDIDVNKGILRTPLGSFKLHNPATEAPEIAQHFQNCINSPHTHKIMQQALTNWHKVHQLNKAGELPEEIPMTATILSTCSGNRPVPLTELQTVRIVDAMRNSGIDVRNPGFENILPHLRELDKPDVLPVTGREAIAKDPAYYIGNKIGVDRDLFGDKAGKPNDAGRYPGELRTISPLLEDTVKNLSDYYKAHRGLVDLVGKHRTDMSSAIKELMEQKQARGNWMSRRASIIREKGIDPGEYKGLNIPGIKLKTGLYAYGMLGGSTSTVPDTHFIRHMVGLDTRKDGGTLSYLKKMFWEPRNYHLIEKYNEWYRKNHPAFKWMVQHPEFGKMFEKPEDATFPAFWANWINIAPYETALGTSNQKQAMNTGSTHAPYWAAIEPHVNQALQRLGKSEDFDTTMPLRAALIMQQYVKDYGEIPAQLLYYNHLVPKLLECAQRRQDVANATSFLRKAIKLEAGLLELRKGMRDVIEGSHSVDMPEVYKVDMTEGGKIHPAGRFMISKGKLHHLEDYHGLVDSMIPEGTVNATTISRIHGLMMSPHFSVTEHPMSVEHLEQTAPPKQSIVTKLPEPVRPGVFSYYRPGMVRPHLVEFTPNGAALDGKALEHDELALMLENARKGVAVIKWGGGDVLQKSEDVGEFLPAHPAHFMMSREGAAQEHQPFLYPYNEKELSGMKTFLSRDKKAGYAIKPDGDIVNVFNYGGGGRGGAIMRHAIANGGNKLDAYDGFLVGHYKKFGFQEHKRIPFDKQFAPKNWDYNTYGTPDIVHMKLASSLQKREATEDLLDADEALQHVRAAVVAGHLHPSVERALTKHLYEDPMVPGIGNKYAAQRFREQGKPGVYASLDANSFKHINDAYGHDMGDDAIRSLGNALKTASQKVGTTKVFRPGGDEVLIYSPTHEDMSQFLRHAREHVDALPAIAGQHKQSFSVGIGDTFATADKALGIAKAKKLDPVTGQKLYHPGTEPNLGHSLLLGHEGNLFKEDQKLPEIK